VSPVRVRSVAPDGPIPWLVPLYMSPPPAPSASHELFTAHDARRARVKGLDHLVPAGVLVVGAVDAFRRHEASGFRVLEFAVGAAFVALLLAHWVRVRTRPAPVPGPAHGPGPVWLELAAAGLLGLEAYHLAHRPAAGPGHPWHLLPWAYGALAGWYVLQAFHRARPASRRRLHVTAEGFWLRRWVLGRARRVSWAALRALVPVGPGPDLLLYPRAGGPPEPLVLRRYLNGPALCAVLLAQAAAHGVTAEPLDEP
jgi:hypothetical protein